MAIKGRMSPATKMPAPPKPKPAITGTGSKAGGGKKGLGKLVGRKI